VPDPEKALAVQRRLVDFRKQLRKKYQGEPVNDETRQQKAVREYLKSTKSAREDVTARFNLSHNQFKLDRSEENLRELLETRAWIEKKLGRLDWTTVGTGYVVAMKLGEEHKTEQAIEIGAAAYENSVEAFGKDHYQTITAAHALLYICSNNPDDELCKSRLLEFTQNAEKACRLFAETRESSPQVIEILGVVASAYGQLGDLDKAIEIQQGVVETANKHLGGENALTKAMQEKLIKLESQK